MILSEETRNVQRKSLPMLLLAPQNLHELPTNRNRVLVM